MSLSQISYGQANSQPAPDSIQEKRQPFSEWFPDAKIGVRFGDHVSDLKKWSQILKSSGVRYIIMPSVVPEPLPIKGQLYDIRWLQEKDLIDQEVSFQESRPTIDSIPQPLGSYSLKTRVVFFSSTTTAQQIIVALLSALSKGENLLLKIDTPNDPETLKNVQYHLSNIGRWLSKKSQAIYGTRTWIKPTISFGGKTQIFYTFNPNSSTLYAISPEWPPDPLTLFDIPISSKTKVTLLGRHGEVEWQGHNGHIQIHPPKRIQITRQFAYVFKITHIP